MQSIPMSVLTGSNGKMYALAYCDCIHSPKRNPTPVRVGFYMTSVSGFSRFSGHAFNLNGHLLVYHRGPDYTTGVEAALLDFWEAFHIPVYSWRLFPRSSIAEFDCPTDEKDYWQARQEFCLAIYTPRGRAHAMFSLDPLFGATEAGFLPVDAFADTAENEEIMAANLAAYNTAEAD